jgi:hypothetical protein
LLTDLEHSDQLARPLGLPHDVLVISLPAREKVPGGASWF